MSRTVEVELRSVIEDGLPDMDALTGQVALIFDGCVVSGWPLRDDTSRYGPSVWKANSDVGTHRPLGGVAHYLVFPEPVWDMVKERP